MLKVKVNGTIIEAAPSENLSSILRRGNVCLTAPCGGKGICGKCKVEFLTEPDEMKPSEHKFCKGNQRLACLFDIDRDIEIRVKSENGKAQIATSIADIDYPVQNDFGRYGVAVDVGTTTVVAYLCDLITGEIIDVLSQLNAQRDYGQDVITRINYARENCDELLHDLIIRQLNYMTKSLKDNNNITVCDTMLVVGNTTMQHIVAALPTNSIGLSPYVSYSNDLIDREASLLGITEAKRIIIAPSVSAFLGGDIVAAALTCDMSAHSILLDLGTNGEFVIGSNDNLLCCSAAAGPAFEGAGIECGVGGIVGAISKVKLRGEECSPEYSTIGDAQPIGICGSGILDIIAELVRCEIIDETGAMDCDKFYIAEQIYITKRDIRQIQLGKAAIAAGIEILMSKMNWSFDDIHHVYIAGGFGSFADVNSLVGIGMLPPELLGKVESVGNAAGNGAIAMLLSREKLQRAVELATIMKNIELNNEPNFQDVYVEKMFFPSRQETKGITK